jgi:hypothetical protein
MQPSLFPVIRSGTSTSVKLLADSLLPSALHRILIFDPNPEPEILETLQSHVPATVEVCLVTEMNSRTQLQNAPSEILRLHTFDELSRRGFALRWLPSLSARIYIIDELVMVRSGSTDSQKSFGILIPQTDSQPIIEFWEKLWKNCHKLTRERVERFGIGIIQRIESGDISKENLVALMNQKGAIVSVHVKFFRGFNRLLLHPFSDLVSKEKDYAILWNLVNSRHYRAFSYETSRLHVLKNRSYLIETPAGQFLLHKDREKWETEFHKRASSLLTTVEDYLNQNFDSLRAEAFHNLTNLLTDAYDKINKHEQFLPFSSKAHFVETYIDKYSSHFPDQQQLYNSCSAWFIRFALHPDTVENEHLLKILTHITYQISLL